MSWSEKGRPTPFDEPPINQGLFYLDGDILARFVGRDWTTGQKLPMISFPSGQEFQIWESSNPDAGGIVHLFGELDLPFKGTRDQAFESASYIAEACGYSASKVGEHGLEVRGRETDDHFLVTYDPDAQQMLDVVQQQSNEPPPVHRAHQLMTNEIREQLPELGTNEERGLDAPASVKYFTPDSGYTWYISEFDGEDRLFGLVVGHAVELGYFSLSELQQTRGPLGLAIERDLYYEPKNLRDLRDQHLRERGQ